MFFHDIVLLIFLLFLQGIGVIIFFNKRQKLLIKQILQQRQVEIEERSHLFNNISALISQQMQTINQSNNANINSINKQLIELIRFNEEQLGSISDTISQQLRNISNDNSNKLEAIRATVEEKLHSTLEKRLNESFKLVSNQLEMVHKSVGEMRSLASDVGNLKNIFANVSTRGIWGEVQLGAIISDILDISQYDTNVEVIPGSDNRVEFAVKLPGNKGEEHVWLPIDAKFPLVTYQQLIDSYKDNSSIDKIKALTKQLIKTMEKCAADISTKYIATPHTTNFAIMFIPIEGLYAEILKTPGIIEKLQSEYRVVITSPTTLSAILNSFYLGFKTLAIEKRSSELWRLLSIVKTEFIKFSDILNKTKVKLEQASKAIGLAEGKTKQIQKHLTDVELVNPIISKDNK